MSWEKVRNLFQRKKTEVGDSDEALANPDQDEILRNVGNLTEAMILAKKEERDGHKIISLLRPVASSKLTQPETRAFSLVSIGETYMQLAGDANLVKARETFTELIDSPELDGVFRIAALIRRASIDAQWDDARRFETALRELTESIASPHFGALETQYVVIAHCTRGLLLRKLGDTQAAYEDFDKIIYNPEFEDHLRLGAFEMKVGPLAQEKSWEAAVKVALETIGHEAKATALRNEAVGWLDDCCVLWADESPTAVIEALEEIRRSSQLTDFQQITIRRNLNSTYSLRKDAEDVQRQFEGWNSLLEDSELADSEWAEATIERVSTHGNNGLPAELDRNIHDLQKVLAVPGVDATQRTRAELYLAFSLVSLGGEANLNRSVALLSQVLKTPHLSNGERANALLSRGNIYAGFELSDAAIGDFSMLIAMADEAPTEILALAYYERAKNYHKRGELAESDMLVEDLNQALCMGELPHVQRVKAHHMRGLWFKRKERYENAIVDFSASIELSTNLPDLRTWSRLERSSCLRAQKPILGVEDLTEVVNDPEVDMNLKVYALQERVRLHFVIGLPALAAPDIDEILSWNEVPPTIAAYALLHRGLSRLAIQRFDDAIQDIRAVLSRPELEPAYHPLATINLAQALIQRGGVGDLVEARKAFQQALALPNLSNNERAFAMRRLQETG